MKRTKLLMSCRDMGGIGHLLVMANEIRKKMNWEVELVASQPAYDCLLKNGEAPIKFALSDGRDCLRDGDNPKVLIDEVGQLLNKIRPDIILTSNSSFGFGLDEACIYNAEVPTYNYQDFWGDINVSLGKTADQYFVLDEFAAQLSSNRWGVKSKVVGYPKIERYRQYDFEKLKAHSLEKLAIDGAEKIILFLLQTPDIPGHNQSIFMTIEALAKIFPRPMILLRGHPKFKTHYPAFIDEVKGRMQRENLRYKDVTDWLNIEDLMMVSNLTINVMSICSLDHAHLSATSPFPLGSMLFIHTDSDLREYFKKACGVEYFPTIDSGLGKIAWNKSEILNLILEGVQDLSGKKYHETARKLYGASFPCNKIIEELESVLLSKQ